MCDIIGNTIKVWDHIAMAHSMSGYISTSLGELFISILLTPSAEKEWNQILQRLVHARDLSIVIFYSNANIAARQNGENGEKDLKYEISKTVREWSSQFIDIVIKHIDENLKDKICDIPVYRQNQTLPRELLSLIASLQHRNNQMVKSATFNTLYSELTG